jgi:hypothetical protein
MLSVDGAINLIPDEHRIDNRRPDCTGQRGV